MNDIFNNNSSKNSKYKVEKNNFQKKQNSHLYVNMSLNNISKNFRDNFSGEDLFFDDP